MRLPAISGGRRFRYVVRLIGYGIAHAGLVLGLALLVRHRLQPVPEPATPWAVAVGIVALSIVLFGLRVFEARDAEALGQDYVIRVRRRLLEAAARRPWSPNLQRQWGVTMSRLVNDLSSLRNWVSLGFARLISAGVALVGLLGALVVFHPPTAWVMVGVVALVLGGDALLIPLLRRRVQETRRLRGRLANRVGEQLLTALTARHLGRIEREAERAFRQGRQLRTAMVRRATVAAVLRRSPELGHGLAVVALLYLVASPTLAGGAGSAGLAVNLLLLGLVVAALRDLVRAWDYRVAFDEGRRRITALLREPGLRTSPDARSLPGEGPVRVCFDAVRWEGGRVPWTFEASPGEHVVVLGASGSGKSMLVRLAARLLDPDAGKILFDGVPVDEIKDLHQVVQLVSPELPLLRGTVRENLPFPPDAATSSTFLDRVAAAAGITGDRAILPEGLDTQLAEGGSNLPGGARARVSLARALLASPRLLLVDDPAFLLDEETARALRRSLALTRVTALVVGEERLSPISPDSTWRLSLPEILRPASDGNPPRRSPTEPDGADCHRAGCPTP